MEMTESNADTHRYNASVADGAGKEVGCIKDEPLGNVLEFIRNHEDKQLSSEREAWSYHVEVRENVE